MSPRHELRALLDHIAIVADSAAQDALLSRIVSTQKPLTIAFLNQHACNLYIENSQFRSALADVDILLRDGIGISLALRALGLPAGLNMNGTDFIPQLTRVLAAQLPHSSTHVYGTASPWLERGATVLLQGYTTAPTLLDGFFPIEHYVQRFDEDGSATKLVVLAMGMPKQEQVAVALKGVATGKGAASGATVIVCGGAILDFCAGRIRRAPRWIRALRQEWLFRLLLEPRRLFSRYISGGIKFVALVFRLVLEERSRNKDVERIRAS